MARTIVVCEDDGEEYGRAILTAEGTVRLEGFEDVRAQYERQGIPDFQHLHRDGGPTWVQLREGDRFLDQLLVEYSGMTYMAVRETV